MKYIKNFNVACSSEIKPKFKAKINKKATFTRLFRKQGLKPHQLHQAPSSHGCKRFSPLTLIWEFWYCTWWFIYIIIPVRGELYPSNFLTTGLYQFHQLGVDFRYPSSFVCRGTELLIPILCPSCGSSKELILLLYPALPSIPTMANHTVGQ